MTEFSTPSSAGAWGITSWTDGNLWFTENAANLTNHIGRITPNGTITEFTVPNTTSMLGITSGSDGNLWIADFFSAIKMSTPGQFQQFAISQANELDGIAFGPDSNIWLTNVLANAISKFALR
ncbi:MAG TPA: hypothetical protein VN603_04995, partial [Candidatus Acidoferrales bacterium]|nr:hypothetical protein [Candidatus Acidoferrales bacterium]